MPPALKALVVAYDFPPHGAIGTMRTMRVVQRLTAAGWDVKVLTSDPASFRPGTPLDLSLLSRVPASVDVVRAPSYRGFERLKRRVRPARPAGSLPGVGAGSAQPTGPRRRSLAARAVDVLDDALGIPDQESAWLVPAVLRGRAIGRAWRPDVIYSSAPPWTGQLVARALAPALRCPWVADFRDPWARAPWREDRRAFVRSLNERLERLVVTTADAVLFVTQGNLDEFAAFYGNDLRRRFHLVRNGCDPEEFRTIPRRPCSDRFVLLHAGTLYGGRNPLPLMRAIARAIARNAVQRERFRLRLVGPISLNVDLAAECRQLGIDDVVEFVPRVSRQESLQEMAAASALLLVQPVTTVSVPGKAYEYLAAGRPILALAEEGETADLVRASGIGASVRPEAGEDAIEAALLSVMAMASRVCAPPPLELYDGHAHADEAVRILERVARREGIESTAGARVAPVSSAGIQAGEQSR